MGENGPLRAETDAERGRWVLDSLGRFGTVAGIVPPVFDAGARILHPAHGPNGEDLRWREVAEREGTVLHPLAQWSSLAGARADEERPRTGQLPLDELAVVAGVLAEHTGTPDDCLAAFWEGFGVLSGATSVFFSAPDGSSVRAVDDTRPTGREHPEIAAAATFELPQRDSLLFSLDVRSLIDPGWARPSGFADAFGLTVQTPLALWPEDRSWYLASEVDLDSTVIGGSRALVDAIVALTAGGRLEALTLPPLDEVDLTSRGDRINVAEDQR